MRQFAVPFFTAKRDDYQFIIVRRNIRKHEGSILAVRATSSPWPPIRWISAERIGRPFTPRSFPSHPLALQAISCAGKARAQRAVAFNSSRARVSNNGFCQLIRFCSGHTQDCHGRVIYLAALGELIHRVENEPNEVFRVSGAL